MRDFSTAEEELRQSTRHLRLANASGPKEQEAANRSGRVLETGTRTADGARQGADRLFLRDDPLVQLFFHPQQSLRLLFLQRGDRHAGPAADNIFDVFASHDAGGGIVQVVFVAK